MKHRGSPGRDDSAGTFEHRRPQPDHGPGGGGRVQEAAGTADRAGTPGRRRQMPLWQELPLLLIIAFCLAVLIRTFLFQAFHIPSGSMENTLLIGDRVLVNKIVYKTRQPHRGEVVVFRGTDNWNPEAGTGAPPGSLLTRAGRTLGDLVGVSQPSEKDFIKRVVGLPGDVVACCDEQGRVTVNGYALDEPYVTENSPLDAPPSPGECRSRRFEAVTVEPGQMFVMGDHRLVSQDSRCQGQVPIENVIGRAVAVVWPHRHWAELPVPATFARVPQTLGAPRAVVPDGWLPGGPAGPWPTPGTNGPPGTSVALVTSVPDKFRHPGGFRTDSVAEPT